MRIEYSALERTASSLAAAAAQVRFERAIPDELGSASSGPDAAHRDTVNERRTTMAQLGELMEAQSRACTETIRLFQLLDAQIASQVMQR